MCHKAAETVHNINNTSDPGATNKHTVQSWLKEFYKGDESLEDKEWNDQPSEIDNGQLRATIEADRLITTQEVAEEFNINHSKVIRIWNKLERWKILISGCLMSWPNIKKSHHFEVSSPILLFDNNEPFLNQIVVFEEKGILYDNQRWSAQWVDWKEAPKHVPKPKLHH